jgi:hypothetical protein
MNISPLTLLHDRETFWAEAKAGGLRWRDLVPLLLFMILACAVYGSVLAGWRSPLLSVYVAIKLPLLFLGTTLIVAVFNWMLAAALGAELPFKTTLLIVFSAMTVASAILLSLAPVSLFFMYTGVPGAGSNDQLQYAHNSMLMTHILVLAAAGIAGNRVMLHGLKQLVPERCPVGLLFFGWLFVFAFVGCQMGWILRPFVGSPFYPVAFMRPDCLDRNFYEFVFTEVLPFLLTGGR